MQINKEIMPPPLILASSSKYRHELLSRLRLPFTMEAPNINEIPLPGETPTNTVLRLAYEKTRTVAKQRPGTLVIGSDQVASFNGEQLGKPGSHENALKQLQKMRGHNVIFHTALCLYDGRNNSTDPFVQIKDVETYVTFRDLADHELDAYLKLEQPYDCAGSAKNEGLGIALIEQIKSTDPTALTGLPLIALTTMLRHAGISLF